MRGLSGQADLLARADWRERASAELDFRLERDVAAPLGVAFSGGGDSVALLALAATWAARRGRRLLALTVDHGLHSDSPAWTRAAGEQACGLGAAWQGLLWTGDKPATGLPAAARRARHALIADAARAAGAQVVLFGHTADDLLEGERMRVVEGVGLGRLRAWSPSPAWPQGRGVFLLRPLLHAGRAELRDWLAGQGVGWRDDPANLDLRFARPRARAALLSEVSEPPAAVSTGPESKGLSARGWTATVDARLLSDRSDLRMGAVAAALLCAAGGDRPPRAAQLATLASRLDRKLDFVAVLAGARIQARRDVVEFSREPGERARGGLAPAALFVGAPWVWDGRFELVAEAPGLVVAAVAGRAGRLARADRDRLRALPPAARAALPLTVDAEGRVGLPRPFGAGPAVACSLAGARFAAATGAFAHERDLSAA